MSNQTPKRLLLALFASAVVLFGAATLGSGCEQPTTCAENECEATNGNCSSCEQPGTYCTTTPTGNCSAMVDGVACCAGGGSSSGSSSGSGCTSQVCCGGLFECNGGCYATCTPGSQPCCTSTNCTCFTPCC